MKTNGLKPLFEKEHACESDYYNIFNAICRNFTQATKLLELDLNNLNQQDVADIILTDKSLHSLFNMDIITYLDLGSSHLAYLLSDTIRQKSLIIKIYDLTISGLTVRQIKSMLQLSEHTIIRCKYIAINELANLYQLYNPYFNVA